MRERLAERREAHVRRSRIYRIGFAIAGATVTLVGIAMLVTPELAEVAQRRAAATTRTQRVLGGLAAALGVAAAVTAWLLWEIPVIPG